MSSDGFYFYNGSVSKLPCSVLSHVFDDLNLDEVYKNFALPIENLMKSVGFIVLLHLPNQINM